MGTPDFAVPTLSAIVDDGHQVVAVYTQPPRPGGRGMAMQTSPVARQAERLELPVFTPKSLREISTTDAMRAHRADAAVVVAYGLILPKQTLALFPLGCFNLHASFLPRWRGAAPIQRAVTDLEKGKLSLTPQPSAGVTYANKIDKSETRIDWTRPWNKVHDHCRGL